MKKFLISGFVLAMICSATQADQVCGHGYRHTGNRHYYDHNGTVFRVVSLCEPAQQPHQRQHKPRLYVPASGPVNVCGHGQYWHSGQCLYAPRVPGR